MIRAAHPSTIFVVLFFSFSFCINSWSQIDSFDLADFVRPDFQRIQSQIHGNLGFGANESHDDGNNTTIVSSSFIRRSIFNDLKHQRTSNIYSRVNFSSSNNNSASNRLKLDFDLEGDYSDRIYFKPNRFVEIGGDFYSGLDKEKIEDIDYSFYYAGINLRPRYGIGRIEIVNDAWLTIRLLEVLQDYDQVIKQPNKEELIALANASTLIRNYRNPDPRLENIFEIEQITYLLDSLGIIDINPRSMALLTDAWRFEDFTLRESGSRLYIGPRIGLEHLERSNGDSFDDNIFTYGADLGYKRSKPLNLKWQWDQNYQFTVYQFSRKIEFPEVSNSRSDNFVFQPSADLRLGYYPSFRTNYTLRANLQYRFIESERNITLTNRNLDATLSLVWKYYLSPNLQYNIESGLTYMDYNHTLNYDNNFSFFASANIAYFFR